MEYFHNLKKISMNNQNIYNQSSTATLPQLSSFYSHEVADLTNIMKNIEGVEDQLKMKQDECEGYLNEISQKRRENDKFGHLSKGVLEAKNAEIKSKTKNIDLITTGIKEVVAKIKVDLLTELKVNKQRSLIKMFKTLYETLYSEKQQFEWERFNKLALKHEGGEDFVSRLVNINFKDLPSQKYDKLMELKNDPEFEKMSTNSPLSSKIVDLTDWVDYVCLGYQVSNDKKKCEREYERIRKDVDKKMKGSLQVSQNFWKEASAQIDKYQNELRAINSSLMGLKFEMKKSQQKVDESNTLGKQGKAQMR